MNRYIFKFCVISVLVCLCNLTHAQYIQWEKCFGGTDDDKGVSVIELSPNNYFILNESYSDDGDILSNLGVGDAWLFSTNQDTNLYAQFSFGGSSVDYASSLIKTTDGYLMAGHSLSQDGDPMVQQFQGKDFWIIKLDPLGNKIWSKSFGGSFNEESTDIIELNDGNIILVGNTTSHSGLYNGNHGLTDAFVSMLDSSGNIIWMKLLGGTQDDFAYSVQERDSFIYVCIYTTSIDGDFILSHGSTECAVIKLDFSGNVIWNKCFGGSSSDYCHKLIMNSNNNLVLSGGSGSNDGDVTGNIGAFDYWIIEIDTSGTLIRSVNLGGINNESAVTIIQTTDKGYLVGGICSFDDGMISGAHAGNDIWISKLDSNFNFQWGKCLGGNWGEEIADMIEATDGTYTILGNTKSNDGDVSFNHSLPNQASDTWLVNLSNTPVEIKEVHSGKNIFHCYSDGNLLKINYWSEVNEPIQIRIYNILGKLIKTQNFYSYQGQNDYLLELEAISGVNFVTIFSENVKLSVKHFTNEKF